MRRDEPRPARHPISQTSRPCRGSWRGSSPRASRPAIGQRGRASLVRFGRPLARQAVRAAARHQPSIGPRIGHPGRRALGGPRGSREQRASGAGRAVEGACRGRPLHGPQEGRADAGLRAPPRRGPQSPACRGHSTPSLLGMGDDGHTASLFPGSPNLAAALDESAAPGCVAHGAPTPPQARLSLNLAALLESRHIVILITGESKWLTYSAAADPAPPSACRCVPYCASGARRSMSFGPRREAPCP